MWDIRKYGKEAKKEWDEFVTKSRNSTFLFMRGYMDYHSDRFVDHSLMAYRNGRLAAILPANITGNILYSHQGLTYGGWLLAATGLDTTDVFRMWLAWLNYCRQEGLVKIIYKPLPYIYSLRPSQEDLYMLYLSNAHLDRTDISTTIDLRSNPGFNKLQKRHLKKNEGDFRCDLIKADDNKKISEFHRILRGCLAERHDVSPVHSEDEIRLLMTLFPENIRIWGGYRSVESEMLAGVAAYIDYPCVHCQYIATTAEGRERDILAPLFEEMIRHYTAEGFRYFDFGISNENGGRALNPGLNRQKTSYGGSGVVYQCFEINVTYALQLLPSELWPPK